MRYIRTSDSGAAIIIYTMIKNFLISAVVCVVGEIALVIVYVVNSGFFSGGIQKYWTFLT